MTTVYLLLLILAGVCFLLSTFNVQTRVNTLALGAFLWLLVPLIQLLKTL